jgi:hypothetical protein
MSRPVPLAAFAAALLLAAPAARAQFTPSVPLPRRFPVAVVDPNAGRARSTRDTTPRVRLSDLKAWFDSVTQYAPARLPAPGTAVPAGPPPAPTPGPAPRTVSPTRTAPPPASPPATPPAGAPPR